MMPLNRKAQRESLVPRGSQEAVEAQAIDHYEYQARQDAATIATLKAILELAESELRMLYKKTGVSGERILRVIEGVRK